MPDFHTIVPKQTTLLIVINAANNEQALSNAKIALGEGADGIFLINHEGTSARSLMAMYRHVRDHYPTEWIGLNFLGETNYNAMGYIDETVSGLWVDDAGFKETLHPTDELRFLAEQRKKNPLWCGLYFGGVAFKYQKTVGDVGRAAQLTAPFVDVVTTSGDATGKPPSLEKIITIRKAIGTSPLANASGISVKNIGSFLGLINHFLVRSSVSSSPYKLDPVRVRNLVRKIAAGSSS